MYIYIYIYTFIHTHTHTQVCYGLDKAVLMGPSLGDKCVDKYDYARTFVTQIHTKRSTCMLFLASSRHAGCNHTITLRVALLAVAAPPKSASVTACLLSHSILTGPIGLEQLVSSLSFDSFCVYVHSTAVVSTPPFCTHNGENDGCSAVEIARKVFRMASSAPCRRKQQSVVVVVCIISWLGKNNLFAEKWKCEAYNVGSHFTGKCLAGICTYKCKRIICTYCL